MLRRIFPHPLLTVALTLVWLALVNKVTVGNIVLGAAMGIVVPILTSPYWPGRPRIKSIPKGIAYCLLVMWDICVANVQVARIILFKRNSDLRTKWVTVPLELTSPEAITILAGTITLTPGTISTVLSANATSILVHCLDAEDEEAVRNQIKARYEARLKEIFE